MRVVKYFLSVLPFLLFISCTSQNSKIVVAEFGDHKIYLDEFEKAYEKNSGTIEKIKSDSIEALKKFLDLYLNYRMKLRDAHVRGYDTDPDMRKELIDYKTNVGSTLFLEKTLYEPNIRLLYERRKTEYRASHIFLTPDSTMNEKQVIELGNKLIERIKNGEDFAALAQKYSKDQYTKNNGGDVYYFSAGLVNSTAIEDAVYSMEAGQVYPQPVYSGFGYHIIKVTEKHPRIPTVHVEHILIQFADSSGVADTAKALKKIEDIQQQLKNGADFGAMALKYSQDKGSAVHKGDLTFIDRGRMVRPFDEAAFKLKKGEISGIVKSQYGFHLIYMLEEGRYPTFEEEKNDLREIYKRIRFKQDYDKMVDKLKEEFKYNLDSNVLGKMMAKTDTLKVSPDYWQSNFRKFYGDNVIFTANGNSFTTDSLFTYVLKNNLFPGKKVEANLLADAVKQYTGDVLVRQKALVYDKVDPDFANLIDEYEKGMYLFKILDEEVWSKITIDTTKIKSYWEQTKQDYKWKDRVEFKEIFCFTDSLVNKCYEEAIANKDYLSLYKKYNQRTGYEGKPGYNGLVEVDFNELAKQANALKNIGDVSKPFSIDDGWSIVKLVKREPARLKTYDEAKAEVASIVQEMESKRLEDEYINKLKAIYKPKVYYEDLVKAFKK